MYEVQMFNHQSHISEQLSKQDINDMLANQYNHLTTIKGSVRCHDPILTMK